MFIRYNDIRCLNDWNDVIEIKYDNVIIGFVTTLELKKMKSFAVAIRM